MGNKAVTSEIITLGDAANPVRIAFFRGYHAKQFREGQGFPRYECSALLDPSNPVHAKGIQLLKDTGLKVATEVYGADLPEDLQKCWSKGDRKDYEGYKGMIVLAMHNSGNKSNPTPPRPVLVNRLGDPVAEGEPEAPFSGCYCIVKTSLWAIKNTYTPRISANFKGLQYVKTGPAFGGVGGLSKEDGFGSIDDGKSGSAPKASNKNPFGDDDE